MFRLLHLKMRRLFLIVLYFLGGAGSAQQSSLLELYFTKRPHEYLVFCTPQIPEEWITQLHWKEEHANGTYSVIAVLNPLWGNYTKFPYQEAVTLHIKDGKTYMMEIIALEICVCCEVVTFPSGTIQENCITIEEKSDASNLRYAILGTLLVAGFFVLGSCVLLCHICMRRNTCRVFTVRGPRQQIWTRRRRSQVPYRRTLPSMNLAYEPPHDTNLQNDTPLPTRAHLLLPHLTIQPPSEDLPPRNPTLNSQWPSEELPPINPTLLSAPPLRNHAIHEVLPNPHQIYSNIHHRNKQYPKARHGKSFQIAPTINQKHPEMFSYECTDTSSTVPYYHAKSCPWFFKGTSCSSEDIASQHSSRVNTPRAPDSPFNTINPMYHSGTGWTSHPKNADLKYEHSLIS